MDTSNGMTPAQIRGWIERERAAKAKAKPVPVLMTPGEVAKLFRVDPKTVTRWATAGKLRHTRTPGGHVRFYRDEILAMMEGEQA